MKVLDVIQGSISVRTTEDRDRVRNVLHSVAEDGHSNQDSFTLTAATDTDQSRIQEMQKSYLKNETSLRGLEELQNRIDAFEASSADERSYAKLSDQLQSVIQATRYDGESVISYMSAKVADDKSLYTLKVNLQTETDRIRDSMHEERRTIGAYLVRQENVDAASGYSASDSAQKIAAELNRDTANQMFRGLHNIQNLLSLEG